jgi:hypothetical protein
MGGLSQFGRRQDGFAGVNPHNAHLSTGCWNHPSKPRRSAYGDPMHGQSGGLAAGILEKLGVPVDAEAVWRALVAAPGSSYRKIADRTGLAPAEDERIGRTLRVGVRTVRRDVAELKSTLGVTSRPEIPAAAKLKGWL